MHLLQGTQDLTLLQSLAVPGPKSSRVSYSHSGIETKKSQQGGREVEVDLQTGEIEVDQLRETPVVTGVQVWKWADGEGGHQNIREDQQHVTLLLSVFLKKTMKIEIIKEFQEILQHQRIVDVEIIEEFRKIPQHQRT